jgi:hypothetical protein
MSAPTPDEKPANWQERFAALLAEIEAAQTPEAEAHVMAAVATLDPALQQFLIAQMEEQRTPEAATFLDALAAHPETPAAGRAEARAALARLGEQGVATASTVAEAFHTGWVQLGRERGEQIMMLAWRLRGAQLEALVFLLDWHGDGIKDFYRTRDLSEAEWAELVAHNGAKGVPLAEITLVEARALLLAALAEGKRFSRPVPREYRLAQALIQRRVLEATDAKPPARDYLTPDLDPVAVVAAYVDALHYRDYLLAWALLAPEHPARTCATPAAGADALRQARKHSPRRRPEVNATLASATKGTASAKASGTASVIAAGEDERVEPNGRKVRAPVRERYALRAGPEGWRIAAIEPLPAEGGE